MNRLSGRRVIVTGGAQGIGAAIVRTIAGEGAAVMVLDGCAEAAALLAQEVGGHAYVTDLTDVRSTREAMDRAIARLGGLDVLVNNAGVMRFCALLDLDCPDLGDVFDMGTRTMLLTMQMAARAMIGFRAPGNDSAGKLINVAGTGGSRGGGHARVAASTAAVMALTRAAAHQLGPHGITVNCLCPGHVLDDRAAIRNGPNHVASRRALSLLDRPGRPQDVASVALFLASSSSDHLTGDGLNVAGGMALH